MSGRSALPSRNPPTPKPKIFCAGDFLRGPKTLVDAMAQGKEAALSIQRLLQGEDLEYGRVNPTIYELQFEPDLSRAKTTQRVAMPAIPLPGERDSRKWPGDIPGKRSHGRGGAMPGLRRALRYPHLLVSPALRDRMPGRGALRGDSLFAEVNRTGVQGAGQRISGPGNKLRGSGDPSREKLQALTPPHSP